MEQVISKVWRRRLSLRAHLLAVSLCALFTAHAQVGEYRSELAVGINGGYLMNKVSFTPDVPQLYMGGITGGITVRYTSEKLFSSICAITAEVNYSQMGWKENILDLTDTPIYYTDDPDRTSPLFYERRINYVQIPVMARMGWGRERKGFQFFFQLGPQMGFFLNESTNTNVINGKPTQNLRASSIVAQEELPVKNNFDYGIIGGGGLEYSHPKVGHFLIEARYYFGLGNVFGNTKADYFGKSNHGAIIIKMSYLFDVLRTKNKKIK